MWKKFSYQKVLDNVSPVTAGCTFYSADASQKAVLSFLSSNHHEVISFSRFTEVQQQTEA